MYGGKRKKPRVASLRQTAASPTGGSQLAKRVGSARGKLRGKDTTVSARAKGFLRKRGRA